MFRAASDDDIEAYSDTVTCFIRKCIDDVVPTKTIRIYPNQKPWINSDVRSVLVYYKDILNYQRHIIHRMGTSALCTVSIHNVVYA